MEPPLRLGLWGHYGGRNLGDACVVGAILHNVRCRRSDIEIVGITLNPRDTCDRYGIEAFPMRRWDRPCTRTPGSMAESEGGFGRALERTPVGELRFYGQVVSYLRGLDGILVAGSGPITDEYGPWIEPKDLLKWTLLARYARVPMGLLCVGAGPVGHRISRLLFRTALRGASHLTFRDQASQRVVSDEVGLKRSDGVYADLAFSLPIDNYRGSGQGNAPRESRRVVGISTMAYAYRHWHFTDASRYRVYLETLAAFGAHLVEKGFALRLLYTDRTDYDVGQELKALLQQRHGIIPENHVIDEETPDYPQVMAQIAGCDAVIGVRYHSQVLGFLLNKPVLAVAYYEKTRQLMRSMGQSGYCVDIEEASAEQLIERFDTMMHEEDAIKERLRVRVHEIRLQLSGLFDSLFGTAA